MAYVYDPNDKDQNQDPNAANQTPQNQTATISTGGDSASAAPQASAGTPASAPKGSGFQNLDNYLNVNQAAGFGGQVAGKVQGSEDKATAAQSGATSAGKNLIDQNTVNYNSGLVGQATSDPTGFVGSDPNNVNAFQSQLNASYQGPKVASDIGDYNKAVGATKSATQQAQALGTEGGRFALLDQYYGRPDYNYGQKSLDNLLIQKDPNAQQPIQQVQQNAQSLQANIPKIGNELNNYATQGAATTANTSNQTRSALGVDAAGNPITDSTLTGYNPNSAYGSLDTYLNSNLATTQAKNAATQSAVQDFQNNYGNPNTDRNSQLAALGLDAGGGAPLNQFNQEVGTVNGLGVGNQNLTSALDQLARNSVGFNAGSGLDKYSAADAPTQAKLAALGQLSGHPYTAPTGYTPAGTTVNAQLPQQTAALASELNSNYQNYFNPTSGYNNWSDELGRNFGTTPPDTSSLTSLYNSVKPYVGQGTPNSEADQIAKMYQALQSLQGLNAGGVGKPGGKGGL